MEDLDHGPRARRARRASSSPTCARSGSTGTARCVFQSARHDAYEAAIERLRADGRVYECFCTRAEIRAAASAPHGPLPEGAYPGTCLRLTDGERAAQARRRAARRRCGCAPTARASASTDRLQGRIEGVVDDFVVRRNDGAPAYNLAVVVDDAAQGIGEVVRGDDLLDSTPRQLLVAPAARAAGAVVRARAARARPRRRAAGQAPRRR